MPWWWTVIEVARTLGVAPWELEERQDCVFWTLAGLEYAKALAERGGDDGWR